ncbi:DUF1289 domain-containing protein [Coraliomargarita akajimensis]|uniref:Fe-S protein n=1 Tax=Coraliomargarita akajimensis (strain DSM 45221 / IAM 15411 / JCM 23193 / KCTC 12865 / 04OKA010-24) TaxID=583355 RepID=D5EL48_CORAD|nr:protein of unknown function DUF1289 [Coraliomargarita akajimensis DSM 45221]
MSLEPQSSDPVASPCTDDCVLNAEKICMGCYRHIDEIVDWRHKPDSVKREILQNCTDRRAQSSQSAKKGGKA